MLISKNLSFILIFRLILREREINVKIQNFQKQRRKRGSRGGRGRNKKASNYSRGAQCVNAALNK